MDFADQQRDALLDSINRAWEHNPRHYGGEFPDLEKQVQSFVGWACNFFNLPEIFVRVRKITTHAGVAYSRRTKNRISYIALSYYRIHRSPYPSGLRPWQDTAMHEVCHFVHMMWDPLNCDMNHGRKFQEFEREIFDAFGYETIHERTPGYKTGVRNQITGETTHLR